MCEDFPCCGHERGCCPDFDGSGKQLNMKCVCGKTLPVDARYSICESCMNESREPEDFDDRDFEMDDEDTDPDDVDFRSDFVPEDQFEE